MNSHIWIMWKTPYSVEPLWVWEQAITVRISLNIQHVVFVSRVYASCRRRIRYSLWEHLDLVAAQVSHNRAS